MKRIDETKQTLGRIWLVLLGLAALARPAAVQALPEAAQDLTDVDEIVERANNASYYAGGDGRANVRLTITDASDRSRLRQFTTLRRNVSEGGDQDYAVLFSRPADLRNTVFIVNKHVDGDDDRWLYLPSLDLVRRIAAGDKRTSFVGSHFLYEDVSGRRITDDRHVLVETTETHYVVENTPVDPDGQEFESWTVWIDKSTFVPTRMEYVDDTGEVYRRIEALEIEEIDGIPTPTRMQVSDLRSGGHTVAEFSDIEYGIGIPEDVFTERTLRNPPRRWFSSR